MQFHDLPPLGFLLAVEAAGRLGSFKAAADELHITRSAVSQQVKAVEDSLGTELFIRRGRSVELTDDGERYLRRVRQALRDVRDAGKSLRERTAAPVLRLETIPFVAYEFLLPRMASLRARFPGFKVRIETNVHVTDLRSSELDATIRLGGAVRPGVTARSFGDLVITLVCSAELAHSIRDIKDVAKQQLIEVQTLSDRGIVNGLKSHGFTVDPNQVQTFDTYLEAVRAAEHGLGVMWGMFPLTTEWVTSGRLAVPLPGRFTLPGQIALAHRDDDTRFPFEELTQWLGEQYAALPALPAGRIQRRPSASKGGRQTGRSVSRS
ncbi:MAG: LysR substrate-binding domain-containing protein [Myxococcales bacterium]